MSALDPLSKLVHDAVIAALEESGKPLRNRLLDTEKAAEYLGVEPDAVKRMHAARKIRSVKIFDRKLMFDVKDLDRVIEENK
ncbi:MAG: helix-turn-helix domain-containing protein [Bryobacteraceae bacterium]|jgi:hypothetical protein